MRNIFYRRPLIQAHTAQKRCAAVAHLGGIGDLDLLHSNYFSVVQQTGEHLSRQSKHTHKTGHVMLRTGSAGTGGHIMLHLESVETEKTGDFDHMMYDTSCLFCSESENNYYGQARHSMPVVEMATFCVY